MDVLDRVKIYTSVGDVDLNNPILYKKDRVNFLEWDMFWLSETMQPHSVGWDAKYERYCTWAKFEDNATRKIFYIFNTHLDHKGKNAQREGAALVARQAKLIAGTYPIIITGDMNSAYLSDAYLNYVDSYYDSYEVAAQKLGPIGTAHNFGAVSPVRIDYIFVDEQVKVKKYVVIDEAYEGGFYPSDHFAVYSDIVFE